MEIMDIAKVCHEANKAYCEALGDDSQPTWNDAPVWQVESAVSGIEFRIDNPDAPPSASHDSWLAAKEAEGWKYGEVKDPLKREHPCFVPFDELPPDQQAKDRLFVNIADALIPLLNEPSGDVVESAGSQNNGDAFNGEAELTG